MIEAKRNSPQPYLEPDRQSPRNTVHESLNPNLPQKKAYNNKRAPTNQAISRNPADYLLNYSAVSQRSETSMLMLCEGSITLRFTKIFSTALRSVLLRNSHPS